MAGLGIALGSGAIDLGVPEGVPVIQRHGEEGYVLPHEMDHAANMRRLAEAGCDRVLAISSVGGLREDLGPGAYLCPDDFIALDEPPRTSLQGVLAHRVPGFDQGWRSRVVEAFRETGIEDGGVYWQATGPRLETRAEIRFIAQHADVVGMTAGSECVAAGELGLAYATVCVVDNYANGIAGEELTVEELEAGRAENRHKLAAAIAAAVPQLG